MNSETKNCQNCHTNFVIVPDDFSFYEKIKVPTPTFCPATNNLAQCPQSFSRKRCNKW